MNRITSCFNELKKNQRKALIPFITAGDPEPALTVDIMHTLVSSGADIIELGIPFSDPMADGPVVQRASERALAQGTRLCDVLDIVKQFRVKNQKTPVVLMGYLNPIEVMGYEQFSQRAQAAGIDGVLMVDMPPEEAGEFSLSAKKHKLDIIYLLAPTTTEERIKSIVAQASGYLYYVSLKGVTGSSDLDIDSITSKVKKIRKYTQLPIGVGFGIKDAATAALVARSSDAVIVGSALVQRIETTAKEHLLTVLATFLGELRTGIDNA